MTNSTDDLGSVTLPLSWEYFDGAGQPHNRLWTLKAGIFDVGEVWHSMANWCWQMRGHEDEPHGTEYPTLEAAQAGLIEAVKASVKDQTCPSK